MLMAQLLDEAVKVVRLLIDMRSVFLDALDLFLEIGGGVFGSCLFTRCQLRWSQLALRLRIFILPKLQHHIVLSEHLARFFIFVK